MNANPLVVVLVGALAGAVAGAVSATLLRPTDGAPRIVAEEGLQVAALERSLDELTRENARLGERLRMLEDRPAIAAPAREAVVAARPEAVELEEELQTLAAALRDPRGDMPENFRQSVDSALRSIREEEERAREEERRERYEQRLDERLAELSVELGLTQYQSGQLRTVMLDINDKRDALMSSAREEGDWMSVRDGMRDLRSQSEASLRQVLDIRQYEQFMNGSGGALLRGGGFPGFGGDDRRGRDRNRDRDRDDEG